MTDGDFFSERREWSRWKHRLLHRYLAQFAGILGSRHKTIYYIDGFAGAGQYADPPEPGSPVIAATLAADAAANQRGYTLRCINVEPEHFDNLVAATTSVAPNLVENRQGTFSDHLPEILTMIGSCPALFFLDPYGHKGMEWDVVTTIAARARSGAATEILLNLNLPRINRDAGWIDSSQKPGPAFVEGVNRLFGTDEWQPIYSSTADYPTRMAKLTDLYMTRLANAFSGIAANFPVRRLDGTLKYHLLHGTHSIRGTCAMSDAVYRVALEYEQMQTVRRQATRNQLDLFPGPLLTEDQRDRDIAATLAAAIYGLRLRLPLWTFKKIQEELVTEWFGRAIEKHYRAACKYLVTNHQASVVLPAGEKRSRGSRGGINEGTVLQFF